MNASFILPLLFLASSLSSFQSHAKEVEFKFTSEFLQDAFHPYAKVEGFLQNLSYSCIVAIKHRQPLTFSSSEGRFYTPTELELKLSQSKVIFNSMGGGFDFSVSPVQMGARRMMTLTHPYAVEKKPSPFLDEPYPIEVSKQVLYYLSPNASVLTLHLAQDKGVKSLNTATELKSKIQQVVREIFEKGVYVYSPERLRLVDWTQDSRRTYQFFWNLEKIYHPRHPSDETFSDLR